MSTRDAAIKAGARRGLREFTRSLQTPSELAYYAVGIGIFVVVIFLNRDNEIPGAGLTTGELLFPGALALVIVFSAVYGLATLVATEREDGTLLRAKSVPHGMRGYVVGQVVRTCLEVLFSATIVSVPATFILDSVWRGGLVSPLRALAMLGLGLLACLPLGFVIGSVFKNPRTVGGWGFLLIGGLFYVSGLFQPLSTLPDWLHPLAQLLPVYWLGLGMRASLLPDSAVAVEIGESWRILETIGVLGAWAIVGLLLAPVLLRRMARRESGSAVSERRDAALRRV